jgi:hypothetical protein
MLGDLETWEVSLVKRGANLRRIAITKKGETDMDPILKTALETECEDEKNLPELPDENVAAAVTVAVRALKAFEIPGDVRAALADMLTEEKKEEEELTVTPEVQERLDALQKTVEEHKAEKEALAKRLQDECDARETKDLIEKAEKDFGFVPGEAEETAVLLKKARDAGFEEELTKVFTAVNEQLDKSALFEVKGSVGKDSPAADELEGRIKEIRKSNPEITHAQAYVEVCRADPDLKNRIREEAKR